MTRIIKNKNMKWWVGTVSFILLFGTIFVFGYKKMCFVWNGVELQVAMEKQENSSLIKISGKAERAVKLELNGREIFIDKQGNFSEYVSPLPGFSIIKINAVDKFGKKIEKKFEIVRENNAEAIAFENINNSNN